MGSRTSMNNSKRARLHLMMSDTEFVKSSMPRNRALGAARESSDPDDQLSALGMDACRLSAKSSAKRSLCFLHAVVEMPALPGVSSAALHGVRTRSFVSRGRLRNCLKQQVAADCPVQIPRSAKLCLTSWPYNAL